MSVKTLAKCPRPLYDSNELSSQFLLYIFYSLVNISSKVNKLCRESRKWTGKKRAPLRECVGAMFLPCYILPFCRKRTFTLRVSAKETFQSLFSFGVQVG